MARSRKGKPSVAVGEILMWMLFVVLLFPAGLIGFAVGHDTSPHAKTVTVTTGAAPATTTAAAPTTTAAAAPTTTAVASPPSVAGGKAVFLSAGCAACHTFTAAGATGKVGPDLDSAPEKDAKSQKMALAAFVKESIVNPGAYISPGFSNIMPKTFASQLGAKKIDELVAFITAGKS